jgi:para-aminobenzoate synthetase component 1
MRAKKKYILKESFQQCKLKILNWSAKFEYTAFLDGNDYPEENKCMLGAGSLNHLVVKASDNFGNLQRFLDNAKDWVFGFFSYDLKNEIELLTSNNCDEIQMPLLHFFQPKYYINLKPNEFVVHYYPDQTTQTELEELNQILNKPDNKIPLRTHIECINTQLNKKAYLQTIEKIQQHISRGDIFEMNFCQEFYATNTIIDPFKVFSRLTNISPTPFSCFYKYHDQYLLSASPERFIKKNGKYIISQPIKGTIRRGSTKEEDEILKNELRQDPKEQAENVMIVDLVRNDLAKTAIKGSVKVNELFGIYSFKQVHQMISTVSAIHDPAYPVTDIIKKAFPMGSMTGAPKIKAMELIEQYESFKRGLYSGAVGYFTPNQDFDFNVIIRSILYNALKKYVSFSVGSAITSNSVPENEYKECLLKADAMRQALN